MNRAWSFLTLDDAKQQLGLLYDEFLTTIRVGRSLGRMSLIDDTVSAGTVARKVVGSLVGAVGVTACLTVLYRCLEAVLAVGGFCASGGPYVIATECPTGIGWLPPVSIFMGFGFALMGVVCYRGLPGPKWVGMTWPGMFLSLAWPFWSAGMSPPEGEPRQPGAVVAAITFILLGGLPLVFALTSRDTRRAVVWSGSSLEDLVDSKNSTVTPPGTQGRILSALKTSSTRSATSGSPVSAVFVWSDASEPGSSARWSAGSADTQSARNDEVADVLRHLTQLREAGELTDEEVAVAIRRVLGS